MKWTFSKTEEKHIYQKEKKSMEKITHKFWLEKQETWQIDKGSFYNQSEWLEEYFSVGLYDIVETESEERQTEYDQSDLSSDKEYSFTETDTKYPFKLCKRCYLQKVPVNVAVETYLLQKIVIHIKWIHRMWNFKFSSNLRKCNTIPGKYITPKDEKHFEIKRRLVTQAIQKGHSTAAKFISLMNLHQALHYSSWTSYTQKLEAVVGAFLKQNLKEIANELTPYMPETGQITIQGQISYLKSVQFQMVLGEHLFGHLVMVLLMYAQIRQEKFWMLLSNVQNVMKLNKILHRKNEV